MPATECPCCENPLVDDYCDACETHLSGFVTVIPEMDEATRRQRAEASFARLMARLAHLHPAMFGKAA